MSFLKVTGRFIAKRKSQYFLNSLILVLSFSFIFFCLTKILYELSFDKHHVKQKRIYKTVLQIKDKGFERETFFGPWLLADLINNNVPDVENTARVNGASDNGIEFILKYDNRLFPQTNVDFADNSIFEIFSFDFEQGSPEDALKEPYTCVMTESLAQRLFGQDDFIGKRVSVNGDFDVVVTGIINQKKKSSNLKFEMLISFQTLRELGVNFNDGCWTCLRTTMYVLLNESNNYKDAEEKASRNIGELTNNEYTVKFIPIKNLHFYEIGSFRVNKSSVYILISLLISVLIFVSINYWNYFSSNIRLRYKEIGIHSLVGGTRRHFFMQFFTEAFLLLFTALIFSSILIFMLFPLFTDLFINDDGLMVFFKYFLLLIVGFNLVLSVFVSFTLVMIAPTRARLSILNRSDNLSYFLKNYPIIIQLGFIQIILFLSVVIYFQAEYLLTSNKGIDVDNILYLELKRRDTEKYELLRDKIKQFPGVLAVSGTSALPNHIGFVNHTIDWQGKSNDTYFCNTCMIDYGFLEMLGIKLKEGRVFANSMTTDIGNYVLNETAIKEFSIDDPTTKWFSLANRYGEFRGNIIGVIEDFHYQPLNSKIGALVFNIYKDNQEMNYLVLKYNPKSLKSILGNIKELWKENCSFPLKFGFLKDEYRKMYSENIKLSIFFNILSLIFILICTIGLSSFSSLYSQNMIKSMSIRKVLGISSNLVILLWMRKFGYLLIISCIFSIPIAFFISKEWLKNYAYAINLGIVVFMLPILLTILVISLISINYIRKLIELNPVENLRD